MDEKLSSLDPIPSVDRSADLLYIVDTSGGTDNKVTPNNLLGISGDPVGTTDTQTLTNKTLTSPTVSNPTLSGTLSGTYTIGGTPTFPSSVVTLTGTQTLTNKTLTSPAINNATIANPTLTVDSISEYTSTNGVTIDGVLLKDSEMNGSYLADNSVDHTKLSSGMVVQVQSTNYSAVSTGTTILPLDDTVPQNTEGTEFMSQAITPKSSSNNLLIQAVIFVAINTSVVDITAALFQDSTANALAAIATTSSGNNYRNNLTLRHKMTAGTTSSTTFKIRLGPSGASTLTFNGAAGARYFGGITKSSITVTEYKA